MRAKLVPRIAADYVDVWVWRRSSAAPDGAELLLLRRAPHRRRPGLWLPVMGRVEPGETAAAAAARELTEETGLVPSEWYALNAVHTFFRADDDSIQLTPSFAACVPSGAEPTLSAEHDAAAWLAPADAAARLIWPGQRELLARVLADVAAEASPLRAQLRLAWPGEPVTKSEESELPSRRRSP